MCWLTPFYIPRRSASSPSTINFNPASNAASPVTRR
jgi:hypothetical protein